ncbi:MAG: Nucleoside 2-deoxyribosyltransferase [uncultured Chloroflexia bacterium]|uniref:Nucleoside 2-deoxyribosyltransferase n=1 Tax=uncultured Chloroflexia bacterium TaxID=1672391 RepID=A0A6J4IJU7_9CHLR|nr:MAG: Nucleoside 2-deoxyribosyltransferase [uncultured Chloroflexia bacterium]
MRLYFAAPLFSQAERAFNIMPAEQKRRVLFETDRNEVLKADIFLHVLDGWVPDEGASVELGIAYAHNYLTGA